MAKTGWNKHIAAHTNATGFFAFVSPRYGKPIFDKTGKRLPPPYGLLLEFVTPHLIGSWAAMMANKTAMIRVADPADEAWLIASIGATASTAPLPGCAKSYQLAYSDNHVGRLARLLGYQV